MPEPITAPVAPAPAAPPAPTPVPAAAPSVDIKSSPFSALDTKARAVPAKVEPVKEPAKDGKTEPKADPAKVTPTKDDRTARDPKWFREQHEKSQTELKTTRDQIAQMQAKIADAEARGKDVTVLSERLAKLEQERDELRGELRAARQEVSPEFKEKWDKPFNHGAAYAKSVVEQMAVVTEDGNTRPAVWNDFIALYNMPINKAAAQARQMFGDDASLVVGQLTELHRLDFQRNNALEEEKVKWKENETQEQAKRVQSEHGFKSMLAEVQKHLAETNPDFQDKPGDEGKESRELRQEGYQLFDEKPKTIQEAATKTAYVRHIVAAHYPLIRERDGLRGKVKELESTIAELRGSRPGPTGRPTAESGGTTTEKTWEQELRETVPN